MKNLETKCHRFWLNNLNPITMKKDDNELSNATLSDETHSTLAFSSRVQDNKRNNFNFKNQQI